MNLHASVTRGIGNAIRDAMPNFNADEFRRTRTLELSESDCRLPDDLFEVALERTLRLMSRDSFVRFKRIANLQAEL